MKIKYNKLAILTGLIIFSAATFAEVNKMNRSDRGGRGGPLPFCALDLDNDGSVTPDEYTTATQNRKGKRGPPMCALDMDNDGFVSLEEFKQHSIRRGDHETIFRMIDADSDGQISEQELLDHKPQKRKNRQKRQRS